MRRIAYLNLMRSGRDGYRAYECVQGFFSPSVFKGHMSVCKAYSRRLC